MNMFQMVKQFHEIFNMEVNNEPTVPSLELFELRVNLISEELKELYLELEKFDREEGLNFEKLSKEMCDLIYVILGMGVSFGLPLDKCFDEVQKSNMSKLDKDGNPIYREDGKVLKSEFYKEPDMGVIWDFDK